MWQAQKEDPFAPAAATPMHLTEDRDQTKEFERLAEAPEPSWLAELCQFLANEKKWWLLPVFVAVLLLSAVVFLAGTGAAPFIYTLF